ncbi:MAG: LamG domain-containing protein [candidate division Zixibacteria bacterium]|nr:LamG domain-containing protein [candidate division Zixibacteria bacterium]NIU14040.1 LamG domain-containing protein [candidate division Zixibacteria bacterium]
MLDDDVNKYMTIPAYSPVGGDFSVELMVRVIESQNGTTDYTDFFIEDSGTTTGQIRILLNNAGSIDARPYAYLRDDSNNAINITGVATTVNIEDGKWHHLALTVDRANDEAYFYVDGENTVGAVDISSLTDDITIGAGGTYRLGRGAANHVEFDCAYLRIWGDERTSTELDDNRFNPINSPYGNNLERVYDFHANTADEWENNQDGTLVGSPSVTDRAMFESALTTLTPEEMVGWHHYAWIWDNTLGRNTCRVAFYLDGELKAETTNEFGNPVWLNTNSTSKAVFHSDGNSVITDIRMWNEARTQAEIKEYMRCQLDGDETNLNTYYRLTEGTGSTVADETANSHDATIQNGSSVDWVEGYREAAGSGDWEDISSDILLENGIQYRKGISSPVGIKAQTASIGTLEFWLNNDSSNSGGLSGYYTLNHTNQRDGFEINQAIRVKYTYGGSDYYKWYGRIKRVRPDTGRFGNRQTQVTCEDWMSEAIKRKISLEPIQTSKTGDEVLDTVLDGVTIPPVHRDFDTGNSTFPYVLDSERDEATPIFTVLQKIIASEKGYLYITGNGAGKGETLVFESRHHRILQTTDEASYNTNTTATLTIDTSEYKLNEVYNKVLIRVYPREIDAAATTVLGSSQTAFAVSSGASRDVTLSYRDPDTGERISGTAFVDPLASTTDYTANAQEDGGGADMTSDIAAISTAAGTLDAGANSAKITITNNGSVTAWITKLQIRGKGIYQYDPMVYETSDADSLNAYGDRELRYDMPYEDDINVAADVGDAILSERKDPFHVVDGLRFMPYIDSTMAQDFMDLEIGSRIALVDAQSDIDSDYFVQNMVVLENNREMWVTYGLIEADTATYWVLDDLTNSVLDTSTRLAY